MPAWTVEMLGDGDKEILAHAVKVCAARHYVCQVTLEPGDRRTITSEADYALGGYRYNPELLRDEVTLTLVGDDGQPDLNPDGKLDVLVVNVEHISELKIY